MNPHRYILLNSTLCFVAAFLLTTFLHELGHFVAYALAGAEPILHHNFVSTPGQDLSVTARVLAALAGPATSLVQGLALAFVVHKRRGNSGLDLLFVWMSLTGIINFFGYLMMTPLSTAGDTGRVAELLQVAYPFRIGIALMGLVLVILAVLRLGRRFSDFIPVDGEDARQPYVYRVMFVPILIGSVINSLLSFPIVTLLSVIYPATSSFVIMSCFGVILKAPASPLTPSEIEEGIPRAILAAAVAAIGLNRLLTLGLSLA